MKNFLFVLAIAALSVNITSCGKCLGPLGKNKIECSNGGTCNEGVCDCLKGYFGPTCDSIDVCELNDVFCQYGDCVDGKCFCDAGYEGTDCTVSSRERYIGLYSLNESCAGIDTIGFHSIEFEPDLLDPSRMLIYNLFNYNQFGIAGFFSKVYASPTANSDNFVIPFQYPDGNDKSIQGNGTINYVDSNNITISMNYTILDDNKTYTCTTEAVLLP